MTSHLHLTRVYGLCVAVSASAAMSCSGSNVGNGSSQIGGSPALGGASQGSNTGGATSIGNTNLTGGNTAAPAPSGGAAAITGGSSSVGGSPSTGGAPATGGKSAVGGATATGGLASTGGRSPATGGTRASGGRSGGGTSAASVATGGSVSQGGSAAANNADCTMGTWTTSDPAAAGPFATQTDNNVGPEAGVGTADAGSAPQFTMFRPKDMTQGGLCHPVITWGNGTSANPSMYKVLLNNLASHGFVVIASNSPNVAQGTPAPMIVGVTWVLEQNDDPSSVLYHRIDTTHIGATGHSQGAMATTQASADSHIVASVPIEGASVQRNLHGPAMFFCGGQDTLVGCSGAQSAITAVTTLPAMFAEYLSVDHGSWMSFTGNKPSIVETAVTAWMRVHLMGDTELRSWFYGPSCKLCTDTGWQIIQKNMDQ